MNTVTLSFDKYLQKLNSGTLDSSASYEIEGNAHVFGKQGITLLGLTFRGSIEISSDSQDIILQDCKIKGDVTCAAHGVVIKNCTAHAISLFKGATNVLVAKCATDSINLTWAYNCTAILNSIGSVSVCESKNIYVIENTVSGDIFLSGTAYLLCDGNKVNGEVENNGCTEYNGDNVCRVKARLAAGAEGELLPHVNKDLFLEMPMREYVLQAEYENPTTFNEYLLSEAERSETVIIPPGAYRAREKIQATSAHSNTVIYAYGAMRENVDYGPAIDIDATDHFSIRGLTVGYA